MSKYTTEVRFICETYAGLDESVGYDEVDNVVEASRRQIFGNYPIFDENYRAILESKILKHYYTREISEETVGLWKLRLNNRMNEIMPYFNKLYNSELIEFNPLYDVDLTRDFKRKNNHTQRDDINGRGNATATENDSGESSGVSWNKFNDTPQGAITGLDNDTYITSATKDTDNRNYNNSTNTEQNNSYNENRYNQFTGLEDYVEHVVGTNGGMSYSKRIEEFRKQLLNIDLQIIDNLKNLFFYLW